MPTYNNNIAFSPEQKYKIVAVYDQTTQVHVLVDNIFLLI